MANYKIYGTNEAYSGKVLNVGTKLFTTRGGALEGNSYEVVLMTATGGNQNTEEDLPTMNPVNQLGTTRPPGATEDINPVTRTFQAPNSPRYMRSDNNELIPIGYNLHEHLDGTIMTEHSMGDNDNSVVVTSQGSNGNNQLTGRGGATGGGMTRSGGTGGNRGGGMGGY